MLLGSCVQRKMGKLSSVVEERRTFNNLPYPICLVSRLFLLNVALKYGFSSCVLSSLYSKQNCASKRRSACWRRLDSSTSKSTCVSNREIVFNIIMQNSHRSSLTKT